MIYISAKTTFHIIAQTALVNLVSTTLTIKFFWVNFLFLHTPIAPLEIICHRTIPVPGELCNTDIVDHHSCLLLQSNYQIYLLLSDIPVFPCHRTSKSIRFRTDICRISHNTEQSSYEMVFRTFPYPPPNHQYSKWRTLSLHCSQISPPSPADYR